MFKVAADQSSSSASTAFCKLLFGDLFLGHLGAFDNVIHHLVLENRRTHLLLHLLVLLHEFKELTFLPRILTCLVHDRLSHLSICHLNLGLLTQFGQQQTKADSALGEGFVLIRRLDLGVIVAFDIRVVFVPKLMCNLIRFRFDKRRRQFEADHLVEFIKQPALHHRTRCSAIFRFQPFRNLCFQCGQII